MFKGLSRLKFLVCNPMKFFLLVLLLLNGFPVPELSSVRQQYIKAALSQGEAVKFYGQLKDLGDENATIKAYKAASVVLLAKYENGLFRKSRLFNKGKKMLEETIEKAPENYEARLIRLNIQENVPWITGYTSDIKKDKLFLIKNYKAQDKGLQDFTRRYVLQSEAFTDKEKDVFQ